MKSEKCNKCIKTKHDDKTWIQLTTASSSSLERDTRARPWMEQRPAHVTGGGSGVLLGFSKTRPDMTNASYGRTTLPMRRGRNRAAYLSGQAPTPRRLWRINKKMLTLQLPRPLQVLVERVLWAQVQCPHCSASRASFLPLMAGVPYPGGTCGWSSRAPRRRVDLLYSVTGSSEDRPRSMKGERDAPGRPKGLGGAGL